MFTKLLIPATIAAIGLIGVPVTQAAVHHHKHHAQSTSLFASPTKHGAATHTHHHSLKSHSHHNLKSRHIHASLHHTAKISHTSKPLS